MSDLIDRQEIIDRLDRVIEKGLVIRCKDCKYYEGVHNIQGHAPCTYWKSGGVLWDWFCSQAERREDERNDI